MEKEERTQVEKKIIEEMLEYFKHNKLEENDEQTKEKIKNNLSKIFKIELDNLERNIKFDPKNPEDEKNDIELKLLEEGFDEKDIIIDDDYRKQAGGFFYRIDEKPYVSFDMGENYKKLESEDPINREETVFFMVDSLIHEIRHYKQMLMSIECISSKEALQYAKEYLVAACAQEFYADNYESYTIEKDARAKALRRMQEIFGNEEGLYKEQILEEADMKEADYYVKTTDYDYINMEKEEIIDEVTDQIISATRDPQEMLSISPILLKEYNQDGSRLKTKELLDNLQHEVDFISRMDFLEQEEREKLIKSAKQMYHRIIYRNLDIADRKDELFEDIKDIDDGTIAELVNDMEDTFDEEEAMKKRQAERKSHIYSKDIMANAITRQQEEEATETIIDELHARRDEIEERYKYKKELLEEIAFLSACREEEFGGYEQEI